MSFQPTIAANRPAGCRRTILIALDGSDHSKYAFRWSLANIVRPDGEDWILLVNTMKSEITKAEAVKGQKWVEVSSLNSPVASKDEIAERSLLENMFATYQSELSAKGIPSKVMYLKGDPREALVSKSADVSADIIIMGSRGMTGLQKAIIGSVSDYCVHNATCPVLIVRKPNA